MYYACPLSQTVQYCKNIWNIVEVISVLTLHMTAVTVKRSSGILKKTLGQRALTVVELNTLLVEVEACINSRPLTFVSDDSQCAQPLSAAHFLLNRRHLYQPNV